MDCLEEVFSLAAENTQAVQSGPEMRQTEREVSRETLVELDCRLFLYLS